MPLTLTAALLLLALLLGAPIARLLTYDDSQGRQTARGCLSAAVAVFPALPAAMLADITTGLPALPGLQAVFALLAFVGLAALRQAAPSWRSLAALLGWLVACTAAGWIIADLIRNLTLSNAYCFLLVGCVLGPLVSLSGWLLRQVEAGQDGPTRSGWPDAVAGLGFLGFAGLSIWGV
jgi:hypothetical protein